MGSLACSTRTRNNNDSINQPTIAGLTCSTRQLNHRAVGGKYNAASFSVISAFRKPKKKKKKKSSFIRGKKNRNYIKSKKGMLELNGRNEKKELRVNGAFVIVDG